MTQEDQRKPITGKAQLGASRVSISAGHLVKGPKEGTTSRDESVERLTTATVIRSRESGETKFRTLRDESKELENSPTENAEKLFSYVILFRG